ncbi:MAG: septum formation family protein [Propionibacteriales bacterium]|nr:septum formation family protein [Propionibacteriales bacterium]
MSQTHVLTASARLVVLAGILALVASCSPTAKTPSAAGPTSGSTPSASSPTISTTTPQPPPETEACRSLTFGDIGRYSNATATTPCDKRHTAFTFAKASLPPDIAFDGVEIRNNAVQQAAADACRSKFVSYVGGDASTRALVRLTVTYFLPGQREFDLGARWIRCDIIALQAERILAELPRKLQGVLADESTVTDYGLCSVAEPGAPASVMVMCNQTHAYRAIAALRLGATDNAYPGDKETRIDGQQRCEDLVSDRLGTTGGYTFSWTYPTAADWKTGQRFGYCWTKSSK